MDKRCRLLERYAHCDKVRQLILVEYKGKSFAKLELYTKDDTGQWQRRLCGDAWVGMAGVGRAAENDSKTPLGDFGMVCAFGIHPDPGALLPYVRLDEHIYCCGDARHYNRLIDIRQHPHHCCGEHMIEYVPEYNYGLFFDYNKECVPGLGFAIFLHCKGHKNYTGGCIAVDEDIMIKILQSVEMSARLCIFEQ